MSERFGFLTQQIEELALVGRYRRLRPRQLDGVHLVTDEGQRLLNFGSNDYLGLVADPPKQLQDVFGGLSLAGATASSLVCGWSVEHEKLAETLASFERTEAAVVFPSGYAACSGTVASLCRPGHAILSDQLNHASLIDGCRISSAERHIYPHADANYVKDWLSKNRSRYEQVWIVTDSVFSMDGDLAPLKSLADVADEFNAILIVDEAHATGVLGKTGGGLCEQLGLQSRIPIRIGTLSKAIGLQGGFVAGPEVVIDYLVQSCRPLIFSTSLSPTIATAAREVVTHLPKLNDRRVKLRRLVNLLCDRNNGVPIIPVVVGRDDHCVSASHSLDQQGYFVPAIRPPTVPKGTARLRISPTSAHTVMDVRSLAEVITELGFVLDRTFKGDQHPGL